MVCFSYRATSNLFSMSLLMLTLLTADRFSRQASFASNPFAICKLYIETNVQQSPKTTDFPSSTDYKCNGSNVSGTTPGLEFSSRIQQQNLFYCSKFLLSHVNPMTVRHKCDGCTPEQAQMPHAEREQICNSLGQGFAGSAHYAAHTPAAVWM